MRKTGRTLSLKGLVSFSVIPHEILNDERPGFAWRVLDFVITPNKFGTAMEMPSMSQLWTLPSSDGYIDMLEESFSDSRCIGSFIAVTDYGGATGFGAGGNNLALDPDHMAVQFLSLMGDTTTGKNTCGYLVTLEEYEITTTEEIIFRLKESAQKVGQVPVIGR